MRETDVFVERLKDMGIKYAKCCMFCEHVIHVRVVEDEDAGIERDEWSCSKHRFDEYEFVNVREMYTCDDFKWNTNLMEAVAFADMLEPP